MADTDFEPDIDSDVPLKKIDVAVSPLPKKRNRPPKQQLRRAERERLSDQT
jgi:hypothetical protein